MMGVLELIIIFYLIMYQCEILHNMKFKKIVHIRKGSQMTQCKGPACQWKRHGFDPGQEDPLEKEMAAHSSFLAWKISWTEETGGLQSMESQRVGHD